MERNQQTAEVNSKLDNSIAGFCNLLSSYFLLPDAFKALEYLVRRFSVHEHNITALMHAALPYHATNEFVRLVQILRLDGTPFQFLSPMQKSGVALPRTVLIQRCLTDRALLRFICEMSKELGSPRVASRTAMSFYAVVLCETITAMPTVDESMVSMLLPYIAWGLSSDVTSDYCAAIYMGLVQLSTRVTMSPELVSGMTYGICKSATPAGLHQALLVLCHLAITQTHFVSFPPKGFKHIAKLPGLAEELKGMATKGDRTQKLVTMILVAAAAHVPTHENYARLMDQLISDVPLGTCHKSSCGFL